MMLDTIIQYFVLKTKGKITKIQLVKFLYLADLYAVKWTGKQLTELDWLFYRYGPWNEEIDHALARMEGHQLQQKSYNEAVSIELGPEAGKIADLMLPISIELLLENIQREWAGLSSEKTRQLLAYVYNTEPMRAVKDVHHPEEKVRLDLQREQAKLLQELG